MTNQSPTRQALSVWPLFVAVGLLMLGNGLQASLLGLRAGIEGFTTAATGLVMTGYYVGFLFGSIWAPAAVGRVGHVRVYAGLASLASTATLAHLIVVNPVGWFIFRVVTGACLAGLYIVAESWLNGASTDRTRGRTLAIYMVVVTSGLALGQLLLTTGEPDGFALFILASVLVSLAVVPISLVDLPTPPIPGPGRLSYREVMKLAPLGLIASLVTGAANGAVLGMGAVWGASEGLGVGRIASLLTLVLIGGVVIQWPLGALSDRFSRRRVIFATTTIAAAVAFTISMLEPTSHYTAVAMFFLGGFSFPMYSLAGSHVNDLAGPGLVMSASSTIMLANGLGSITGPLGAALVMTWFGASGLWSYVGAVHGILALYALVRLVHRWDVPAPNKGSYLPLPARSGGLISWGRIRPRNGQ